MRIRDMGRERIRRLRPGDVTRLLLQEDVYHILRELLRERFVGPFMLLLGEGSGDEARKRAADELNALASDIPEGVMNVLARNMVIRLREGIPIHNPTAVLDLSEEQDKLGHRISESINSVHKPRVVSGKGEFRKNDRLLVACFCVPEWLVLDQVLDEIIPPDLGITVEHKLTAVIDATGNGSCGRRSLVSLLDRSITEHQ